MSSDYPPKREIARRQRESSVLARQSEIEGRGPRRAGSRTAMSGLVQRLARSLGKDPEQLAAEIDPDTIRRTKFPVIEGRDEHGRITFKEDPGILEGARASIRK